MVQLSLSSEDRLLLYCSRLNISKEIKYKIEKILNESLDWNYILECSVRQGISPLFYWNLSKIGNGKDVPSEVMKSLQKTYYRNFARNMLLYDELSKVLMAFRGAGIDTIVLKGAFLAEGIYKNIGLRPMNDIDLLVKEKDLQKAKRELTKLMYFTPKIIFPTKLHEQFQMACSNELPPFVHETRKICIEIHWDIQPPQSSYKVDINEFWNSAKSIKIDDIEALTFAPEDILQHLCLHLHKHINSSSAPPAKPLRDYCDIAEVIKHYKETINWESLIKSSNDHRIEEPIFQGLYIANKYFEAFVPENVLQRLCVKSTIVFEKMFKIVIENNLNRKNQLDVIYYLTNLKLINGTCNKVRIIFGDIFPSKEFMIYRYSIKDEKQVYKYYLIRLGTAVLWGLDALWQFSRYFFKSTLSK
ncbi:nucleotidyltransferase family protein [Methanosarcina sp. Z-7115]|uniref:Nucleotidyltransferase family protein n=1 Tax=Methanosarcina baikalica TaxID=3073890 RepID=A0ABU2D4D6_9EURY|nr:nucleotidyltransferase family protein [Methanosarcina sp. Z-7115]MDR7666855.1 nucleotidyltransferase family protein [Methanosarcina sp. Z-7115]